MQTDRIITGSIQTNCYIVTSEKSSRCFIIDPGDSADKIDAFLRERKLTPAAVLLTHGHFDHILGLQELKTKYHVPVCAMAAEQALLEDAALNCSAEVGRAFAFSPDRCLQDGEKITLDDICLQVIATPGHTAGSCCFYEETQQLLFTGDTLFFRSIGRTDFPTGNFDTIMASLEKLKSLPEDTRCLCGHGPETTIRSEKANNPYLRGRL